MFRIGLNKNKNKININFSKLTFGVGEALTYLGSQRRLNKDKQVFKIHGFYDR